MLRHLSLSLALSLLALCGCTPHVLSPETWSLSHLPAADVRDLQRNPAFRVEMMIALQVAKERCSGPETPILNRMSTELFALRADPEKNVFGGPRALDDIRGTMTFEYRRTYRDRWWDVLSAELLASYAKYENHPDPAQFCRLAEDTARQAFFMQGPNQIAQLGRMYRQLAPGNAPPPAND
jgi:hypothetical protein